MVSIHTNVNALMATRYIGELRDEEDAVRKRVATGERVASAYEDGASWAVGVQLASTVKAADAVTQRLQTAKVDLNRSLAGIHEISKSLVGLRDVAIKLADESLTGSDRVDYENQFVAMSQGIYNAIKDSRGKDGNTFLDLGFNAHGNPIGEVTMQATPSGARITIGGPPPGTAWTSLEAVRQAVLAPTGNASEAPSWHPEDAADALRFLTVADNGAGQWGLPEFEMVLSATINHLASEDRQIGRYLALNATLADATAAGRSFIVDADLGKDSALLQASRVRSELALQGLSIVNQAPRVVLSLFN